MRGERLPGVLVDGAHSDTRGERATRGTGGSIRVRPSVRGALRVADADNCKVGALMHGFKRDRPVTEALRANYFFEDPGSFVSLPDSEGQIHFHLEGEDRRRIRDRVWEQSKGLCEMNIKPHAEGCPVLLTYAEFEMDHVKGGTWGRCDCVKHGRKRGNLRALSRECHRAKHVHTRFGEKNDQSNS